MTIVSSSGVGWLTKHGKIKVAASMYQKGRSFIMAALLLRGQQGYDDEGRNYVVLHLICQGLEIILKSLLLYKDYDMYIGKIKKNIGHDLVKASKAVSNAYGRRKLPEDLQVELEQLNELYKYHRLRYGSGYDLLVNPQTIPSSKILRRIYRIIRIVERYINWE